MTERAEAAQTRLTEAGESSKAEELNEKILRFDICIPK